MEGSVKKLAFSENDELLAIGGENGKVKLWSWTVDDS